MASVGQPQRTRTFRIIAALGVVAVVVAAYASVVSRDLRERYDGNYSGFLRLSREFYDQNPLVMQHPEIRRSLILIDGRGYDAQFMYYEVFDPFMRTFTYRPFTYRAVVDAPPYRYGRIGYSLVTRLIAGDHWRRYPPTMIALIVIGAALSALMLALIAQQAEVATAWGLLACFVPGFWTSLQVGLPEPLAAGMLLAAYFATRRGAWAAAGACAAISLLIRETGVILVLCLAVEQVLQRRWRHAVWVSAIAILPVLAWRLYVGFVFYPVFHAEAFFMNPGDLGVPFGGFVDLWRTISHGQYGTGAPEITRAGFWYPCLLTAGFMIAAAAAIMRPTAISVAAACYGLLAVSLNYGIWQGLGNGIRGTYELFVTLALVTIVARDQPKALRAGLAGFWALAALYVFVLSDDAAFVRGAFLLR